MYDIINEITFKISPFCNLDCEYCFQKYYTKTQHNYFDKYDDLFKFLLKLPLGPKLEIKLTGGETSLYPDQIRLAYKKLKKLERYKNTEVRFTTISNGTNMKALINLFEDGILDSWGSKISWDGIYSASKSRKPKNKLYDDDYFNNNIKLLGQSKFGKNVLVRTALTKNTIDDLYNSAKFCFDNGCTKWEYYYLTDAEYYKDLLFQQKFINEYRKLVDLYIDEKFNIQNIDTILYTSRILKKNKSNKLRSISCRHLGTSLYISMDGSIYPCGFFTEDAVFDDCKLSIGNIYDGFYKSVLEDFCEEYSQYPMCDIDICSSYHCFECPAVAKYRKGHLQNKLMQACVLRALEIIFSRNIPVLENETLKRIKQSYDFVKDWNINRELNSELPFI